jgi:hypothetical protein
MTLDEVREKQRKRLLIEPVAFLDHKCGIQGHRQGQYSRDDSIDNKEHQ